MALLPLMPASLNHWASLKVLYIQSVPFDNIVICGDFNVDFKRTGHFLSSLTQFMLSHNLVSVDCIFPIDYTYCRDDNSAHSWPDHILTTMPT